MPATRSRARGTLAWYAMPTVPPPPKTMPRRREAMPSPWLTRLSARKFAAQRLLRQTHPVHRLGGCSGAFVAAGGGLDAGAGGGGGGGGGGAWAWLGGG